MRIQIIVALCMIIACTSCAKLFNKNKETIKVLVISRESDKGINVKNFTINKHTETKNSIRVLLSITDMSNKTMSDTLNFITTGDGFVIP